MKLCLHYLEAELLRTELTRLLVDAESDCFINIMINPNPDIFQGLGNDIAIGSINELASTILAVHADAKGLIRDIEDIIRSYDL